MKRYGLAWVCVALVVATGAFGETKANGLVMLFTDYGADELNVGSLKGAIYRHFPEARIDSLTNTVPAFDVEAGAHLLAAGCATFPSGTTFCCIVDPSVGTERKVIALETKNGLRFVAPDNGLLTAVAAEYGVAEIRACTNEALWDHPNLSNTFHGRDLYGPVAAALARGVAFSEVGEPVEKMVRLDLPLSDIVDGKAVGAVILIDAYGNCVTNIRGGQIAALGWELNRGVRVSVGSHAFDARFVHTYASVPQGERLMLVQESDYVELAINMGNLAQAEQIARGAALTISAAP